MKKRTKVKNISLPMKFNAGLEKFEPELPIIKKGKKVEIKFSWELIVIIFGLIFIFGFLFFILSKAT